MKQRHHEKTHVGWTGLATLAIALGTPACAMSVGSASEAAGAVGTGQTSDDSPPTGASTTSSPVAGSTSQMGTAVSRSATGGSVPAVGDLGTRSLGADSLATCANLDGPDPLIYGPGSCPFGRRIDQWAGDWWVWAAMIPKGINPVFGGACDQNQSGDVWFLAGSDGTTEQRACAMPAGKALLVPLINGECHPWPAAEGCGTFKTEGGLAACAMGTFKGETPDLLLEVDGYVVTGLERHMTTSTLFSLPGLANATDLPFPGLGPIPENNCGIPAGDNYGVTYGSYVMLKPLAPGQHVLHLRGAVSFYQPEVTYTITVR